MIDDINGALDPWSCQIKIWLNRKINIPLGDKLNSLWYDTAADDTATTATTTITTNTTTTTTTTIYY